MMSSVNDKIISRSQAHTQNKAREILSSFLCSPKGRTPNISGNGIEYNHLIVSESKMEIPIYILQIISTLGRDLIRLQDPYLSSTILSTLLMLSVTLILFRLTLFLNKKCKTYM